MKKIFQKTAVFFLISFIFSMHSFFSKVYAGGGEGCVPVYGGGFQCPRVGQVLVDKSVRNPSTGVFVDNLSLVDPKYRPQWIITFRVTVKNSGEQALGKIVIIDKLPQYVDFMSGPGIYDAKNRTLTWEVYNLPGGASQVFEIKGRIVHSAILPPEKNILCLVNIVDAKVDGQSDHDETQFCLQKEVTIPSVPSAGPESWIFSLSGLSALGALGAYLRRKFA